MSLKRGRGLCLSGCIDLASVRRAVLCALELCEAGVSEVERTSFSRMPPECAGGEAQTPASEVYRVGASLYERLTGVPPYHSPGLHELNASLSLDEPAPVRALAPAVPLTLAAVVQQAIARRPEGRPPDLNALSTMLREWLLTVDEPVNRATARR